MALTSPALKALTNAAVAAWISCSAGDFSGFAVGRLAGPCGARRPLEARDESQAAQKHQGRRQNRSHGCGLMTNNQVMSKEE